MAAGYGRGGWSSGKYGQPTSIEVTGVSLLPPVVEAETLFTVDANVRCKDQPETVLDCLRSLAVSGIAWSSDIVNAANNNGMSFVFSCRQLHEPHPTRGMLRRSRTTSDQLLSKLRSALKRVTVQGSEIIDSIKQII